MFAGVCSLLALSTLPGQADGLTLAAAEEAAFRETVLQVSPSVVRIETVGGLDKLGGVQLNTGATTGTVVAPGRVLSSAFNFVGDPSAIFVTLEDGRRVAAERIATDEVRQLVLLRVPEAADLPPITPAELRTANVGDWTLALGRTYSQPIPNVSIGLLSARSRLWGLAIQTDAKVSPTNYGGPLVNLDGETLGILVPLSPQESGRTAGIEWYDSGIGFAIPVDAALTAAKQLEEGEDLKRGLAGIAIAGSGLVGEPATIARLHPSGPADEAGLDKGDRVIRIDDRPIESVGDFKRAMTGRYAGQTVRVAISGDDGERTAELQLVDTLPEYQIPQLGVVTDGAAIVRIVADDTAASGKIEPGDRVIAIGQQEVGTTVEAIDAVADLRVGEPVSIRIVRDGRETTVDLTPGPLATSLPKELAVPALDADRQDDRGRVTGSADGADLEWAAYLPERAAQEEPAGLLLWLAGGNPIADYRADCEIRNIALLVPRSVRPTGGFAPDEADDLLAAVRTIQRRLPIDPARIAVYAEGGSSIVAVALAEDTGSPITGILLSKPRLQRRPEPSNNVRRLLWALVESDDRISKALTSALQDGSHPLTRLSADASPEEIVRWVDWMGRF